MNSGNRRFIGTPQAHEVFGIFLHELIVQHRVPRHGLGDDVGRVAFGVVLEVIAGAKSIAGATHNNHVHPVIGVRCINRLANFARHFIINRIQPLWPVERDRCDTPVDGDFEGSVVFVGLLTGKPIT